MDTSLYEMKNAGRRDLPEAAIQYSTATQDLAGITDAGAFPSEAAGAFIALLDGVQNMLADVCEYLADAGEAIVQCADDFAATDQAAADALKECERERTYHKGSPDGVPDPARPGDRADSDNDPLPSPGNPAEDHNDPLPAPSDPAEDGNDPIVPPDDPAEDHNDPLPPPSDPAEDGNDPIAV